MQSLLVEFKVNSPDYVVVVEASTIYHPFFNSLLVLKTKNPIQYIFHVLGNFTRYGEDWFALNYFLVGKQAQFIVASSCYQKVLSHFIPEKNLTIIPFPLDLAETIPKKNTEFTKVLYAGRYHKQKNVSKLIHCLDEYAKNRKRKITLSLVVYFDDFNPTTLSTNEILGNQFADYSNALKNISSFLEIKLLPHQNETELYRLYKDHDLCISLSTFLDEDYGYSIVESLSNGTPAIVSNWGGYIDFCLMFPNDCFGLEVIEEGDVLYLNTEKFSYYLDLISQRTLKDQEALAQRIESNLGEENLKSQLLNVLKKKNIFNGFDQELSGFSKDLKNKTDVTLLHKFKKYYGPFWGVYE
jgi:glycosyltransferase involved in cell wall biosynthesis